ncbi:MAG: hypothetical protein M0034_05050 [Deltaproteobacteria bacterium]|jgi:uncharacterized membrane protein|nr:hypothetical protein [Deltaproteobacteria bacterium]
MNFSILIFIAVFSVAIVELSEVAAIVFVVGEDVGLSSALAGGLIGFIGTLIILFIGGIALIKTVPIFTVKLIIGVVLISIGLYFSYKLLSFIFYLTPFSQKIGEKPLFKKAEAAIVKHEKCSFRHFIVALNAVIIEAFEVAVVAVPLAITENQWLSVISALIVSSVIILMLSIYLRRYFKKIPSHWIKGIASVLLISFGIYWGLQGLKVNIEDDDLVFIVPAISLLLLAVSLIFDKIGYKIKGDKKA